MDLRRFANICLSTFMFSRVTVFLLNEHDHDRLIVCWPKEFWDLLSENWLKDFFLQWNLYLMMVSRRICTKPLISIDIESYWYSPGVSASVSPGRDPECSKGVARPVARGGAFFLGGPLSQRMSKLQSDRCDVSPSKRCDFPKSWELWTKNPRTIPCCSSKLKVKPSHVAFL